MPCCLSPAFPEVHILDFITHRTYYSTDCRHKLYTTSPYTSYKLLISRIAINTLTLRNLLQTIFCNYFIHIKIYYQHQAKNHLKNKTEFRRVIHITT